MRYDTGKELGRPTALLNGRYQMGFFDFLKSPDINKGVKEYNDTPGAVLLDVRTPEEYREGHIPGSKNVPLQALDRVGSAAGDRSAPLFVYCYSGNRSRQAAGILTKMGYSDVRNIGGISSYTGKVVR